MLVLEPLVPHPPGLPHPHTFDLKAFHNFRGWEYEGWSVPQPLVDVAVTAIRAIAASADNGPL